MMIRLTAHTAARAGISSRLLHSSRPVLQRLHTKFDLPDPTVGGGKCADGKWIPRLTKICATIGPTSEQLPVLQEVRTNTSTLLKQAGAPLSTRYCDKRRYGAWRSMDSPVSNTSLSLFFIIIL